MKSIELFFICLLFCALSIVAEEKIDSLDTEICNIHSEQNDYTVESERTTNPVSLVVKFFMNVYQRFVTNQDNHNCQFNPSCSQYARHAFALYNPVKATFSVSDRLLRCNPLAYRYYLPDTTGRLSDPVKEKNCD